MTIFRRVSRGIDDPRTVLEASTSASGFMLGDFDNKDNVIVSRNVIIDTAAIETIAHDHRDDDDSSVSSNYSNSSASSLTSYQPSTMTTASYEKAAAQQQAAEELAQAILHDFRVKMDDKSGSVVVSMDVPEGVDVDQLQVEVDNGILRVRGETFEDHDAEEDDADLDEAEGQLMKKISNGSSSTALTSCSSTSRHHRRRSSSVEQTFQLDEHALDLDNVTATFTDGVLTIAAPRKQTAEETVPKLESLPIHAAKPPRILSCKDAFRVIVNIPGVHTEDIFVTYKQSKLCISAFRHFGRVRSFKRTIPVDTQQYQAHPDLLKIFLYEGQLTIIVPPKETQGSTGLIEIQE